MAGGRGADLGRLEKGREAPHAKEAVSHTSERKRPPIYHSKLRLNHSKLRLNHSKLRLAEAKSGPNTRREKWVRAYPSGHPHHSLLWS
jgi:hypothetical protein